MPEVMLLGLWVAYGQLAALFALDVGIGGCAGLRADGYAFDVKSSIAANSGNSTAGIVSPKAAVAWTLIKEVELYANYGEGFHSNVGRSRQGCRKHHPRAAQGKP